MLQKLMQCKNFLILKSFSHHIALRRKSGESINHFVTRRSYCSTGNPSSSIWLQVLQSGGRDAAAGLYIFADSRRYLVNAGENTLRQLRDSAVPISGLSEILLTGSTLNHIGGLTNTLLLTQDRLASDRPIINVYGAQNLDAYMHTTRKSFQYLSKFDFVRLKFASERTSWQQVSKDENFTIWGCAFSEEQNKRDDFNMIYPRLAISYFFEVEQPPRRLCVDSARRLGVPGQMMREVAEKCLKGNPVTLPSDKVIHPDDVLLTPERKQSFLIIDCPSPNVLAKFIQTNMFSQDPNTYADLIIHLTPLEIAATPEYKAWMDCFGGRTKHVLTHDEASSIPSWTFSGFDKVYEQINRENPEFFPTLSHSTMNLEVVKDFGFASNVVAAVPSLRYIFRPRRLVEFEERLVQQRLGSSAERAAVDRSKHGASPASSLDEHNDFEVVFLGTGSRTASILRNTSGILLNMSGNVSLLMDCGEGTYRQMCHHYGKHVDEILKQLRTVFVSHMHIDHHLGLINILLQRKRIMGDSDYVRIIGPESLDLFLRYFEMLSSESLNFRFTQFWWLKRVARKKEGRLFSRSLGLSSIAIIPTKHSHYSHGIVLERDGWKIVYSADTRPCKQLIDAGVDATLLIHEATFEDQLLERAKAMSHCTASEAIRTSELMKAQHTILTHFSSRHLFPCKASRLPDGVSFTFDHMTVQQKDLPKLHRMMPSLESSVLRSQQVKRKYPRNKLKKLRDVSR